MFITSYRTYHYIIITRIYNNIYTSAISNDMKAFIYDNDVVKNVNVNVMDVTGLRISNGNYRISDIKNEKSVKWTDFDAFLILFSLIIKAFMRKFIYIKKKLIK